MKKRMKKYKHSLELYLNKNKQTKLTWLCSRPMCTVYTAAFLVIFRLTPTIANPCARLLIEAAVSPSPDP